jgi:hypothetical protein
MSQGLRSWFGSATRLLCTLFAAFCFYQHASDNDIGSLPIERIHPADRVIVDAPQEALATDFARLTDRQLDWNASDGSFTVAGVADPLRELADPSADAIRRADYRLLVLQAKEAWDDGTYNEVHVRTLQPWQWVHEQEVHVGGYAPLPLDTLEMGLPEGMTGKVIDILPCPTIKSGRGRVVLTTINRLARGVIELTLRNSHDREETLRPTGEHLFYSVTQGDWLSAEELQPGEHLDGINGTVTVTSIATLPGTHRVYNLSVQGEHLYRVANCGVLVHNNYAAGGGVQWKNGWRTADGKFASPQGTARSGAAAESAVWDAVEAKRGWQVIRGEVSVRDAAGQLRKYDGAAISPNGRVIGLEVKSGTATRTVPQRTFDSALNSSGTQTLPTVGRHAGRDVRRSVEIRQP